MRLPSRLPIALALTLGLVTALPVHAGVPSQLDAQGVLRDGVGDLIDLPDATLLFRMYDAATGGNLLWSETQTVPVVMGVFDARLPASALTELPTAVQQKLAVGAPLWLSIQLSGQTELPRTALVSVPYAFTANRALLASDLACSGCIDASDINTSTFTAQHLVYTPASGDLVTATTVGGAIGQLDDDLADHIANANAHHPADSTGIAIKPTSVTVGATTLTDGSLDLGAGANDSLSAAQVTTLTAGGNADALHKHTAQSISGLPSGGSCYTRWGSGSCAQGYTESNVGTIVYPYYQTNASTAAAIGAPICLEGGSFSYGQSGPFVGWLTGGANPQYPAYSNFTSSTFACGVCCPAAPSTGSCRNETIYRDSALYTYYSHTYGNAAFSSYGPLSVGFTGRSYAVSAVEVMLSVGGANSVGAVSAYDLKVTDSAGNLLDRSPLRYLRMSTGNDNTTNYGTFGIYRADVTFTLPADNKITVTTLAVSDGQPAPVLQSDGCVSCGAPASRSWVSVTGCAAE